MKTCDHEWELFDVQGEYCPCTGWSGNSIYWKCKKCKDRSYENPFKGEHE